MRSLGLIALGVASLSPVLGFIAPLNPVGAASKATQPSRVTMMAESSRGESRRDLLKSAGESWRTHKAYLGP